MKSRTGQQPTCKSTHFLDFAKSNCPGVCDGNLFQDKESQPAPDVHSVFSTFISRFNRREYQGTRSQGLKARGPLVNSLDFVL